MPCKLIGWETMEVENIICEAKYYACLIKCLSGNSKFVARYNFKFYAYCDRFAWYCLGSS